MLRPARAPGACDIDSRMSSINHPMIKRIVSGPCLSSGQGTRATTIWQRPLSIVLLGLASASSACMSDVDVSECAMKGTCHSAGSGGTAGSGGSSQPSGGEAAGEGGEAGETTSAGGEAGVSGAAGAANASNSSGGGDPNSGGYGSVEPTKCPNCKFSPTVLPAPCGTLSYSSKLRLRGGTPPYAWSVSPPVDGWTATIDPTAPDSSYGVLTGAQAGASEVSVTVIDGNHEVTTITYDTTPRAACWFAYTALTGQGGGSLALVDPILEKKPPVSLSHNHDVYDFAFSPNGRYLSYRFDAESDHEKGKHLALLDLSTWTEQDCHFSGDPESGDEIVTAYAWSPDSSTLAASFLHDGTKYLGGIRVTSAGQLGRLTPQQTSVDSELYWVGSSALGYYANGVIGYDESGLPHLDPIDGYVTAYFSKLGSGGFGPATLSTDVTYQLPVFAQPTTDGLFLNSPSWPQLQFNWLNPDGPFGVEHGGRTVSPSGRVTAGVSSATLDLYRAEHRDLVASGAPGECPKLLAWAAEKERLVCVRDVPADSQGHKHSELRIFDLAADNSLSVAPVEGYCEKDVNSPASTNNCGSLYDYTVANSALQPRIFSKSGNWLAFAPSTATPASSPLYLADLRSAPFRLDSKRLAFTSAGNETSATKLSFSPDERYLLRLLSGVLTVHSVSTLAAFPLSGFDVDAPDDNPVCSDDFASAPDRWCGSESRATPFGWAPSSRFMAFRSRDSANAEALTVVDLTPFPSAVVHHDFPAPGCGTKCSGQFAFQP